MLLCIVFMLAGSFLMWIDVILGSMGVVVAPIFAIGYKSIGLILIWIGPMLYLGRNMSTGGFRFTPLANSNETILIHMGKSNAKILRGKKEEPNRIRAKGVGRGAYMNIRDMGNNIVVAGHDVAISTQDDGHTVPLIVCDAVDKWKKRYNSENEKEFLAVYEQIKNINSHRDLFNIEFLKPIMSDSEKAKQLLDMSVKDLRDMKELLFDGRTINVKSYLGWAEDATPYDNEAIINSTIAHDRARSMSLRFGGQMMDWGKYIIPIVILMIMGAIAYQIFGGG